MPSIIFTEKVPFSSIKFIFPIIIIILFIGQFHQNQKISDKFQYIFFPIMHLWMIFLAINFWQLKITIDENYLIVGFGIFKKRIQRNGVLSIANKNGALATTSSGILYHPDTKIVPIESSGFFLKCNLGKVNFPHPHVKVARLQVGREKVRIQLDELEIRQVFDFVEKKFTVFNSEHKEKLILKYRGC